MDGYLYEHRRYIQKASYQILPRYIETGKDGIWQRKDKLGEKYEVESLLSRLEIIGPEKARI